uniref:NADP-dependent oxidoreductase domain-containing protein n=1 Tax=Chromera velia CCMP2878 TaxID=1169474 RepID=A0A0G4GVQ9_9ALVE|mmetsp:Transcript_56040/g.109694  ORF Transcript_56040/g.109694 Transcript_56040/m.109694 type:complete len:438 (+) Transcript_56040:183-1496(+)|eukprot:Cvel_23570.t1-p1 / transcript=Cvel_23570.t1 / gene=Cvel_23570 / organism=Chromera_velia_CCMP2878 / gene_product=Protein tas, putative / transcript_product=Protein tas, putative / location=Cvel_scaffold2444:21984-25174(-) / protein_length=437 / sequence_SO=supercontig / SO=protein_coding / is_pseudo=false
MPPLPQSTSLGFAKKAFVSIHLVFSLAAAFKSIVAMSSANGDGKWPIHNPKMKYNDFGNTGWKVSDVCLGTMTWGSFNTEEETFAQLDEGVKLGVNIIDTAEMYPVPVRAEWITRTEELVGKWIETRVKEGKLDRSRLYIATKVAGNAKMFAARGGPFAKLDQLRSDPPKKDGEERPIETTPEQMMDACLASLRRLKCEYIDLYQIHWPARYCPAFGKRRYRTADERPEDAPTQEHIESQVMGIKALFDKGLIKAWGLSNESSLGVSLFCNACDKLGVPRPASIQNDFSLMFRCFEEELAETCRYYNVAGFPYGPLAGGTLSGKYTNEKYKDKDPKAFAKRRHNFDPKFQARYHCDGAKEATTKYVEIAEKAGLTPTQLALAWCRSCEFNHSTIMGSTSVEQLKECISAFTDVTLSEETMAEIDKVHKEMRNPMVTD